MLRLCVQETRFGEASKAVRMESIQSGTSRLKLQGGWSEAFRWGSKGRKMRYRPARKSDVGSVSMVFLESLNTIGLRKTSPFVGRGRRSQSARYHHVNGVPRRWVQG